MKFPMHVTKDSLTVLIDGKAWQTDSTNTNWSAIIAALNDDRTTAEQLVTLLSPEELVRTAIVQMGAEAQDVVGVHNGSVWFKGEVVNNALCQIILNIAGQGLNPEPWLKFTNKLFQNPSDTAKAELYLWLDKANLPICPDGDFLAYKRVSSAYKDLHTHTFDNSVGQVVSMPREKVDPVRDHLCSTGLHFCSKDYLPHFGNGGGSRVVLVKINPADVVSIPSDYDNAKGRTWRYEVVGEIDPAEVGLHVWPAVAGGYDAHSWENDDDDAEDERQNEAYDIAAAEDYAKVQEWIAEATDEELGFEDETLERDFDAFVEMPIRVRDVDSMVAAGFDPEMAASLADAARHFEDVLNQAWAANQTTEPEEVVTVEPVIHSKSLGDITRQRYNDWVTAYGSQAAIGRALGKASGTVQAWYVKLFQ